MEWLRYSNVLETAFGLKTENDKSSATHAENSSPAEFEERKESTRIPQDAPIGFPADADRELQHCAYRSSGLLESWHPLSFFAGNTQNCSKGHPNNPIEDMRFEADEEKHEAETNHFDAYNRDHSEFPSVIVSSSSEDSSFRCESFTDDEDESIAIHCPIPTNHESLHGMEEGRKSAKRLILSKERFEELAAKNERHFRPFGHGKFWTCLSLFFAWTGVLCAVSSAHSVRFVRLEKPILITPLYDPVDRMGLLRTEICLNATAAGVDACKVIPIDSEDVRDNKFGMARLFLMLGTVFGVFFSLILSTSVYWESINLRPVAAGFLFSYFFQSLSMLFFDTGVCTTNKCRVDVGCALSILAALGWIATCIATSKMDSFKILARRQRRRRLRQQLREEYKKDLERKNYGREPSTATETTYVSQQSNYSTSSSIDFVEDQNIETIIVKSEQSKRFINIDPMKLSNRPPTVVKILGIDPADLHEC
ncbi:hypothetical protein FisN_15Hh169 [Fistulifera solaris]|jgi:hypothetical protein|uniref:Transmembrane protein n=1 Tax=Fistulifera solaris TaxID=1519565 RepID=A0A1Z5JFB6_FISSO|nr:hypothetical protein FisN_15Hh169 [Fistulifera solaris]|eukprot:GAX12693.1 hypothetical protein FisN_15Hh169 [Fistulifera solaris]